MHLTLGISLGLSLATMSCGDDGSSSDTVADDATNADAVTYAGPDDTSFTGPTTQDSASISTTATETSTTFDPTDADAVTYGGPDESSSTTEGTTTTDATTTETAGTDTTGTTTDASSSSSGANSPG